MKENFCCLVTVQMQLAVISFIVPQLVVAGLLPPCYIMVILKN